MRFLTSLLLSTVAIVASSAGHLVASAAPATATGYLVDNQCVGLCMDADPGVGCTPDGSNVFYNPYDHTGSCLLLQVCVDSGYSLMSELPTEVNGRHSILLGLAGDVSQTAAVTYIKAGTKGAFPAVTVVYDDELAQQASDGTLQALNVSIVDPWDPILLAGANGTSAATGVNHWSGAATTQEVCLNSTSPNLAANNFCYRSDVVVSISGDNIVIESNGCPDHPNMQGSNGTIPQSDPILQVCGAAANTAACGACGGCGSSGCGSGCGSVHGCSSCASSTEACSCNPCSACGICQPYSCCGSCGSSCGVDETVVVAASKNIFSHGRFLNESSCGSCGGDSCGSCAGTCNSTNYCSACSGCGSQCSASKNMTDCCAGCGSESGCSGVCSCNSCGGCGSCGCGCGGCGSGGCGSCGCGGCGCGCGVGMTSHGLYQPLFQHYKMVIPQNPVVGEPTMIKDDVVGILSNGVLLDSHKQTWAYDSCNGHSDKKHQYHYHIPPICLLESMGVAFADSSSWWINDEGNATRPFGELASQFPEKAPPSPIVGFARDGHPIYGLYDSAGTLQQSAAFGGTVDECNGKVDSNGEYGYYLTVNPPFAPSCLKGEVGLFTYATSDLACPSGGIQNTINVPARTESDIGSSGNGSKGTDGNEADTDASKATVPSTFGCILALFSLLVCSLM